MDNDINSSRFDTLVVDDIKYRTILSHKYELRKPYEPIDPKKLISFLPGTVHKVFVKKGSRVKEGDRLFVLEAMKMRNDVMSPLSGIIKDVLVKEGEKIAKKHLMLEFE